jgi:KaiC/GvpD/RAD55 family RecA-like ATPase
MTTNFYHKGFDRLNLSEVFDGRDLTQPMLVPDLIPEGEAGLLVGEPGSSKTEIALTLSTALALGVSVLGLEIEAPRPVVYVALEGSARGLGARVHRIASELKTPFDSEALHLLQANMHILTPTIQQKPEGFDLAETLVDNLDRLNAMVSQPGLVVFDTLATMLEGDENQAATARRPWAMAQAIANGFHWSVVMIHHSRKISQGPGGVMRRGSGIDHIRGSSAHSASARFILELTKKGMSPVGARLQLKVIKRNDGAEGFILNLLRNSNTGGLTVANTPIQMSGEAPRGLYPGFNPNTKTGKLILIYENPGLSDTEKDEQGLKLFSGAEDPMAALRSAKRRYKAWKQATVQP